MDIKITKLQDVTVVEIHGDIDASTAPKVQEQVIPLAQPGSKILLDMTNVKYTSSAGLRFLLSLSRQVKANEGRLVLVGVSDEIKETMFITGFLDFFTTFNDQEAGLKELSSKQKPDTSHQDKGSKAEL